MLRFARTPAASSSHAPVIKITNGTFFRHPPDQEASRFLSRPLFSNFNFELPSKDAQNWCVVGPSLSGKTSLLKVLQGGLLCQPPTARSYPYLSSDLVAHDRRNPFSAIRYVGFDAEIAGSSVGAAAYLSARYESRREITDFSLRDFLLGNTELNPARDIADRRSGEALGRHLDRVAEDLGLSPLLNLPVAFLSNGQIRKARIARALLQGPEVLLLDEPFMGLDPLTAASLNPLLHSLAEREGPRLVLSSRPQDPLPEWVTHLVYLRTDCQIGLMGPKHEVLQDLDDYVSAVRGGSKTERETMPVKVLQTMRNVSVTLNNQRQAESALTHLDRQHVQELGPKADPPPHPNPKEEALLEMGGCVVRHGAKAVLGNWSQKTPEGEKEGLLWTVRRGERWGVFGPNGSGKTTIVSLICSDHPQAYSLPLKLFGRGRLPDRDDKRPPMTLRDVQSRIGHSSPEVHRHIPRNLSIRQVLENAWADTFGGKPNLTAASKAKVDAVLGWFEPELNPDASRAASPSQEATAGSVLTGEDSLWADEHMFGRLSLSSQRVALFLRAVIKGCDLIVLDEAFSGMDGSVRDKCMLFLAKGGNAIEKPGAKGRLQRGSMTSVGSLSDRQALICISHVKEECPDCVREWLYLPEANAGLPARMGRLRGPLAEDEGQWNEIWGMTRR